jgi:dTDP-glucose pyrophosphorylase
MTSKAVVLARGLGRRMQQPDVSAALTREQQRAADLGLKSMVPIRGRPFLEFVLGALAEADLHDVALVVAPEHDAIDCFLAERRLQRLRIDLLVQQHARGTADAVLTAEPWAGGEAFLVLNADNLYPIPILRALAGCHEPALPVFTRRELVRTGNIPPDRVQTFAFLDITADGYLARIVEKPSREEADAAGPEARVSMNCWRFDGRIFDACRKVPRSPRGELELPEAVAVAVADGVRFRTIPAHGPVLDLSRRSDTAALDAALAGVHPRL